MDSDKFSWERRPDLPLEKTIAELLFNVLQLSLTIAAPATRRVKEIQGQETAT
jgi:hypothetical protein